MPYESLVVRAAGMRELDPALVRRLTQAYGQLRPWLEARRVLAAIAATMAIGAVTNRSDELGHQVAGWVGVPFVVTVTAPSAGACKPWPESYQRALDALALSAGGVLFVAGSLMTFPAPGGSAWMCGGTTGLACPVARGPGLVAGHRSLNPLPAFVSGAGG